MREEERNKRFGSFLKSARTGWGFSQREAATKVGISAPYLAQLERGERNPPSHSVLTKIAKGYNIDLDILLHEGGYNRQESYSVSPERINWAFEFMCRDPDYYYASRIKNQPLTIETKAFLIELYQNATGRQLLTEDENAAAQQMASSGEFQQHRPDWLDEEMEEHLVASLTQKAFVILNRKRKDLPDDWLLQLARRLIERQA